MKESRLLSAASTVSIFLFWLHVADDITRGLDRASLQSMIALLITVGWLYLALVHPERKAALVPMFILSVLGTGVPALHLRGLSEEFVRSSGAILFLFTLYALSLSSGLAAILSGRALFRRADTQSPVGRS